jgi:hypothetical protein
MAGAIVSTARNAPLQFGVASTPLNPRPQAVKIMRMPLIHGKFWQAK